jgi:hypothetical protein
VPAAAVIPAPIAYIKIVAVKKLVVGFLLTALGRLYRLLLIVCWLPLVAVLRCSLSRAVTLRKLECFKQVSALNTPAWNNKNDSSLSCWFKGLSNG